MIGYTEIIPRSKKTKNHELNNKKSNCLSSLFQSRSTYAQATSAQEKKQSCKKASHLDFAVKIYLTLPVKIQLR